MQFSRESAVWNTYYWCVWPSEVSRARLAFGCFCRILERVLSQTEVGFGFSVEKLLKRLFSCLFLSPDAQKGLPEVYSGFWCMGEAIDRRGATWRHVIGRFWVRVSRPRVETATRVREQTRRLYREDPAQTMRLTYSRDLYENIYQSCNNKAEETKTEYLNNTKKPT